jgi:uncharacterized spore protein YtfJ
MNEANNGGGGNDGGTGAVEALTTLLGEATPKTIFSEPVSVGNDLVITAVAWERGGGFGFGGGSDGDSRGFGSGGGGGAQGRPVAVIRVSPTGIDVEPVIDFTKIGITVLVTFLGIWKVLSR